MKKAFLIQRRFKDVNCWVQISVQEIKDQDYFLTAEQQIYPFAVFS